MFVNGTQKRSYTGTPSARTYDRVTIGALLANGSGESALNGYMDDLRITKGVARYTTDFTVPTLPFSTTPPQLSGTVVDQSNNFVARAVRSHRKSDGAFGGIAVSSAVDGTFSVNAYDDSEHYVVCFSDGSENALIFDNITPV